MGLVFWNTVYIYVSLRIYVVLTSRARTCQGQKVNTVYISDLRCLVFVSIFDCVTLWYVKLMI